MSQYQGTVISALANFYWVFLEELDGYFLCTRRSLLKKVGKSILVGDLVIVEELDYQSHSAVISQVLPRSSILNRPPIANASQILLVFALADPPLDPWQLSRFLIKTESTHLQVSLCLNKTDLVSQEQAWQWQQRLQGWGYQPLLVSLSRQEGIEQLASYLLNEITILSGPSGVGKSSLINALVLEANQKVAHVSGKLHRGRHTTRHVELFKLPSGGMLADSPGFNQADLECSPSDLVRFFPEVKTLLGQCQFNNCLHREEPNCAIRGNWERYEHYLQFLSEVLTEEISESRESTFKVKMGYQGIKHLEPKLEFKKYRQNSRRQRQQDLQHLYRQDKDSQLDF